MNLDWHTSANQYLCRLGFAEWLAQGKPSGRRGQRYHPSQYHRDLVALLDQNKEEQFKAMKMLQGYANALGV